MSISTNIGTTTPDAISVRGLNLADDIIGKFDFVDMLCWLALSRRPTVAEKAMLNAVLVTAADHGFTPSTLSARLTYLGAPESLQGAVAAGLLGAGDRFLGTVQNVSEMLTQGAVGLGDGVADDELQARAQDLVAQRRATGRSLPGIGHPIHAAGDPRVPVLKALSQAHGVYGRHWRLALAIPAVVQRDSGKTLHLNAAGAVGAILADMGMDPVFGRGLALVGRTAGLVAHVLEERSNPIGQELWSLVLKQDSRNVLPARTSTTSTQET